MTKSILIYFIILLQLISHQTNCEPLCPPTAIDITPCQCIEGQMTLKQDINDHKDISERSTIGCFGRQPLDLANIFEILDANVGPENKDFQVFYINNTYIREIPENVFKDFKFKEIIFDRTTNLTSIDENAFGDSNYAIEYLHAWDTGLNISSENSANIQFFDRLKNLKYLDFSTIECPPEQLLGTQCRCEKVKLVSESDVELSAINCQQISNSQELVEVFINLGKHLKGSQRNFFRFYLKDSLLRELPEDLFNGITFSEIFIESVPKLISIHKDVFKSTQPFVNNLWIRDLNLIDNNYEMEDLWYALSSLNNLVTIRLVGVIDEIPSKAFKIVDAQTQWRLVYFEHFGDLSKSITKIGSYAFYNLPNIQIINLEKNQLNNISKYSFANQVSSDKRLLIKLAKNKITPNSFIIGSLSASQRPIKLQLGHAFVGCNRDLSFLEESVFSPFLDKDGNELDMGCSFTMDCDCRMKWLYDAPPFWKDRIKSGSFGDLILPCSVYGDEGDEEVSFWDLPEDYFDCENSDKDSLNLKENITVKSDLENLIDDVIPFL